MKSLTVMSYDGIEVVLQGVQPRGRVLIRLDTYVNDLSRRLADYGAEYDDMRGGWCVWLETLPDVLRELGIDDTVIEKARRRL